MLAPEPKQVAYDPARYIDIETVDEAVKIIVTPTEGMTAKQRWDEETPVLMSLLEKFIERESVVLDYGCGIGRLAKPLISKHDCKVVGVDISANMRALAESCVDSSDFFALHPHMFDEFIGPKTFHAAIAIWALQHCIDLPDAIDRIHRSLSREGVLVIVNNITRCVPVEGGEWADDGLDVHQMILDAGFKQIDGGKLDEAVAPGWMQQGTFWAVYER
jgi:SAM-dependent methyltransferase